MELHIATARPFEAKDVSAVLQEAGRWLEQKGVPLWTQDEVAAERISTDVAAGQYVLARDNAGVAVGTFKLHEDDPLAWPDAVPGESLFLHQMALVRREAGKGLAQAMLAWAVRETKGRGKRFLRLDFRADRPKLRSVYEHCGFRHHSDRPAGAQTMARYEFEIR